LNEHISCEESYYLQKPFFVIEFYLETLW
jgi:hypothetical protein